MCQICSQECEQEELGIVCDGGESFWACPSCVNEYGETVLMNGPCPFGINGRAQKINGMWYWVENRKSSR